jgi:integration host factor subunit alpha
MLLEVIMIKSELVNKVFEDVPGISKKEAALVVDVFFETINGVLAKGEDVKISGFGNFSIRNKRERPGRNPKTGAPVQIAKRRVVTFRTGAVLRKKLNK